MNRATSLTPNGPSISCLVRSRIMFDVSKPTRWFYTTKTEVHETRRHSTNSSCLRVKVRPSFKQMNDSHQFAKVPLSSDDSNDCN